MHPEGKWRNSHSIVNYLLITVLKTSLRRAKFVFSSKLLFRIMVNRLLITLFCASLMGLVSTSALAQPAERKITRSQYIDEWKDEAVRQMELYGIPASITLAQGILESADGNSALAKYANNHFGIKCHNWGGEGFYADDDKPDECFRKYESAEQSYVDHSEFLSGRSRYAFLFDLKTTDYKGWARGLKKAGYATNPKYPDLLIRLIEDHQLAKYDKPTTIPHYQPEEVVEDVHLLSSVKHVVKIHENKIRFVEVKPGDSFYKIASEFDMRLWQIYKYNDLKKEDIIHPGDVIYLQPKRRRADRMHETHVVVDGQTMNDISQLYGVKVRRLYKMNNMRAGTQPFVGQELSLRKQLN